MKLIERLIEEGCSDSSSRNFVSLKISENVVRLIGRHFPSYVESDCSKKKHRENMCDEAHFWLNGYVNKQNYRIWSGANPQVCVETPLHSEKLTVWCALWAGGILLQKR
ncbi:putative DD41D transposase [Trichonephila clavipes]|nr:putative DD41D transposase [Trichonephila clavipes]